MFCVTRLRTYLAHGSGDSQAYASQNCNVHVVLVLVSELLVLLDNLKTRFVSLYGIHGTPERIPPPPVWDSSGHSRVAELIR